VSAGETTSEEAVVMALASHSELTGTEIAAATGLGRSTVGKTLAALERAGMARRSPGGRDAGRRLPDRWSVGSSDEPSRPESSARRLRPGQLDGLVLDYINSHGSGAAVGATAVAKALGRSAGAVGNCLTRLAAAGQVRQVSEKPRRYGSASSESSRGGRRARQSRKERS
jgi:DNA-binding transcriptional ArsR family regulator